MLEDEVFIENTRHEVGSKNAGGNSNEDVVLSTDHVILLANGFSGLNIYVRPPSLFRERGITPILDYGSVSPINSSRVHFRTNTLGKAILTAMG